MNRSRIWFLASLIVAAAASRLIPHPPNVTPLAAIALFGGATLQRRWLALLVPLAALLSSDLLLQATYQLGWQPAWGFYRGQWVVYACFLATALLGGWLRDCRNPLVIAVAAITASLLFFLATNFAVWSSGLLYPRTAAGLALCYTQALPFLRNSLLGDLAYSGALFGALGLLETRIPRLRPRTASV